LEFIIINNRLINVTTISLPSGMELVTGCNIALLETLLSPIAKFKGTVSPGDKLELPFTQTKTLSRVTPLSYKADGCVCPVPV